MIRFKELPKEIQDLVKIRTDEYSKGKKCYPEVTLTSTFSFKDSIEGSDFWVNVAKGNFEDFYKRYPKISDIKINYISNNIYKGKIGNRKIKITIEYED